VAAFVVSPPVDNVAAMTVAAAVALAALVLAALVVATWAAVWRAAPRVEMVTKPLALLALIALAVTLGAPGTDVGVSVLVALGLALVGDVFLLGSGARSFVGGLGAFLLSDLAYLVAFVMLGFHWIPALVVLVLALFVLRTAGHRVQAGAAREGGPWLGGGTTAYMLVLSALAVTAAGTALPLVLAGALVFLVSDLVLGLDRFVGPRARADLVVMVTYHVGQVLMVVGALTSATASSGLR
jgi:uncharacterized membrane protein YhhN